MPTLFTVLTKELKNNETEPNVNPFKFICCKYM